MIIDIIMILKCYLIFLLNRPRGGVRIRTPYISLEYTQYPYPNKDNLCYNTDTLYITR